MKALITGASSGIGRDIAKYLSELGYDLVIVARRKELLEELKNELKTNVDIECYDISIIDNCKRIFEKHKDIDILVNNAGFGIFGTFDKCDIQKELELIKTNVIAVYLLTKLYIKEMEERKFGRILNVSSISGLMPGGPYMAAYYASKSYIVSFSRSINKELQKKKSNVKISILCPGAVNTNFHNIAGAKCRSKTLSSKYVAKYAIDEMFKNKEIIIPGFSNKISVILAKFFPWSITSEVIYKIMEKSI